jgi:hypothetical protein
VKTRSRYYDARRAAINVYIRGADIDQRSAKSVTPDGTTGNRNRSVSSHPTIGSLTEHKVPHSLSSDPEISVQGTDRRPARQRVENDAQFSAALHVLNKPEIHPDPIRIKNTKFQIAMINQSVTQNN